MTLTSWSRSARPTAASISSGMGGTMVLSWSGRFSVIVATGPSVVYSSVWNSGVGIAQAKSLDEAVSSRPASAAVTLVEPRQRAFDARGVALRETAQPVEPQPVREWCGLAVVERFGDPGRGWRHGGELPPPAVPEGMHPFDELVGLERGHRAG